LTVYRHALLFGLLASVSPVASAPAWAGPAAAPPRVERVKIAYHQFTLPNGLTAIVYTDHSVPRVHVGLRYRTGSKDEPAGRSGFAHLFEHLMFQSTRNRKGGFLQALEAIGASSINGQTTTDWTDYHETVPSGALDLALWMESDRMSYLADGITPEELEEQRGVVKNEKRQGELQPGAKAADRYLAGYYPEGHPYAHAVIGSMEDLDRASLADVKQWFDEYYGASNAVLVVAGDVDFDTAREKITRYFGAVRPGKAIDRTDQWLPAFSDVKRDTVYDAVPTATISRTWPVSNEDPREKTLLQLAARTMAGSQATPLARALVDEAKIALGAGARLTESQLGSSFTLSVTLRPGVTPEQAGPAIDAALARFLTQGPDAQRLGAVIAGSDAALLRLMESAPAVGGWLLASSVDHDDPTYFLKQRDWIGSATAPEVRAVATKWLARPYYELRVLPRPLLQAAKDDVDRSHPPAVTTATASIRFPSIRETRLANGLKVVVAERHALPVVDARLQFDAGTLLDPHYAPGAARQAFQMMDQGTTTLNRSEFAARISAIGSGLSVDVGGQQAAISWSATGSRLEAAFALAADAVRHPSYPQAEIDKLHDAIDAQFDGISRNPIEAAGRLYARAIWGADHPFGRMLTRAAAQALDRAAIQRFHDAELGPNDATLYLIGDITLEQARALAERHFGSWKPVQPTPVAPLPPAATAGTPRIILVDAPGAPQTSITAGHLVGPYVPERAPTERLLDAALGGSFQSRLNSDLRESKGWAYGFAAGITDRPKGQRLFTASGTVQADKTAASMTEIRNEIRAFASDRPITAAELERERASAVQSIPLAYAGNAAFLTAIVAADAYGQPRNYAEGAIDRLGKVTLDQARSLAAQTYRADALTWVVVGDLARIEAEVRALAFAPVEVWDVTGNRLR
jgi:zinc protease